MQVNQLPSDVFCRWVSSDAYLMHRCFSLEFFSYPAIRQNPDDDHSQMLQKERTRPIHCKQIYSSYSWSAAAAFSCGKQSGAQWGWLGFAVGCIVEVAPLKWKSPKPFLKHGKLCFSFSKGTFDYCQHWRLCLKSKSQLLNWLLRAAGRISQPTGEHVQEAVSSRGSSTQGCSWGDTHHQPGSSTTSTKLTSLALISAPLVLIHGKSQDEPNISDRRTGV